MRTRSYDKRTLLRIIPMSLKSSKPITWSLNNVRRSSALQHIYTDWLQIATDTDASAETGTQYGGAAEK